MLENIIYLAMIALGIWIIARWGAAIFLAYAIGHFIAGQWLEASIAIVIAGFLSFVQALTSWFMWDTPGRTYYIALWYFRRFPF